MSDVGFHFAFWSLSAITVGGALMVVVSRNLIHAVIFLILSFLGVAGLYLTLSAEFLALAQILVYVGAIAVLMLFAIMLTPHAARDNSETPMRYPAAILMGLVIAASVFVVLDSDWGVMREAAVPGQVRIIGESLINAYVLPFEIAAVLLTAALVGAVALAREDPEDAPLHRESLALEQELSQDPVNMARVESGDRTSQASTTGGGAR